MPLNISNVSQGGGLKAASDLLLDNNIAAAFGLVSQNDTLAQFHNRFGNNSVFLPDKKTFIIRSQNHFNVNFTFMPQISKVNVLFNKSLMAKNADDLKYFVQEVNLPKLKSKGESTEVMVGFMAGSLAGDIVWPDARNFTIDFLNTEFSLHEHCFYYWLKETVTNIWEYTRLDENLAVGATMDFLRPFTKADISINMFSMRDGKPLHSIVLTDCFPIDIESPQINQDMSSPQLKRKVTFAFNNMYVKSVFVGNKWESKLKSNIIEDVFNSYIGNKITNKVSEGISNVSNSFDGSPVGQLAQRQ